MPSIRRKAGKKQFIINAAEARRFADVVDTIKYIAFARDKDDLLTASADKLADDIQAFADAIARPLAKRTGEADGGKQPLFGDQESQTSGEKAKGKKKEAAAT